MLYYIICKFDWDSSSFTDNKAISVTSEEYRNKYLPSVVETINGTPLYKDTSGKVINPRFRNEKFNSEILVTSTEKEYYIVIFAMSPQGVLSQGFGKYVEIKNPKGTFSIVNNILIDQLKTEGSEGSTRAINDGELNLLTIEAPEPGFTWNASVKGILSAPPEPNDENEPSYDLYIPEDATEYRITIRKPSDNKNAPNTPSSTIYVEVTGYNAQGGSPNFVFNEIYNNPNFITGYRDDPEVWGWNDGKTVAAPPTPASKSQDDAEWLSISGSGFNILNDENVFPLRKYDIVVEAHDGQGLTSAGNTVFQNTLFSKGTDKSSQEVGFSKNQGINATYDVLGVNLAAPESVMYTQITGDAGNWNKRTQYLSPENAYLNELPYLAQAYIYPNGWLETSILLSESTSGTLLELNGVVQDEEALENKFNNAAGMVYYYTTGDNTVEYVDELDNEGNIKSSHPQLANPAPAFNIKLTKDTVGDANNAGVTQQLYAQDGDNIAYGGIINAAKAGNRGTKTAEPQGNVHRGFYLFSDSDTIESLRIPFPDISRPKIQNIQLSYAFFDDYHLLSAFEPDGSTPKTKEKSSATKTNQQTVKTIFTEENLSFSEATFPLRSDMFVNKQDNAKFGTQKIGVSQSIYLTESSVQSAGDSALGFRAWGTINLNITAIRKESREQDGATTTNTLNDLLYVGRIGNMMSNNANREATKAQSEDFKDIIFRQKWEERSPLTLKTVTASDIQSISMSTSLIQFNKAKAAKTYHYGSEGRVYVTLKLPSEFGTDKLGIITEGFADGFTSGSTYKFTNNSLEIIYTFQDVGTSPTQFTGISLFFGILATNE